MQAGQINETLVGVGGQFSAFIASGASTTTLKKGPGRLCRIVITTAGTAAFNIFDNTAGSGSVLYVSPAATSVGQVIDVQLPAQIGITAVNIASGPAFAISFN
jgi:NADPH-dependent curcumin reductase CurA